MPVCPHDWRKHSCSFCPAESCCIMGVLKALGSERPCLTKPWWLAADRKVRLWASCQKLIFRRFSVGCSGSSMTVWGLDILVSGEGWGGDRSFVKATELVQQEVHKLVVPNKFHKWGFRFSPFSCLFFIVHKTISIFRSHFVSHVVLKSRFP